MPLVSLINMTRSHSPAFLCRSFFAFLVAIVLPAACSPSPAAAQGTAQSKRPNVILIMTDDQGYGDLGVHGNPIIRTPSIDAMAAKSAVLTHFYVSPDCTPTRSLPRRRAAAILTQFQRSAKRILIPDRATLQ